MDTHKFMAYKEKVERLTVVLSDYLKEIMRNIEMNFPDPRLKKCSGMKDCKKYKCKEILGKANLELSEDNYWPCKSCGF